MNRHPTEAMIQAAITAGSAASENGWMDCVTHAEMEAALSAALAVEAGTEPNPMSFFSENVDRWGAAEWFNRLANAIREQDKACVAKDDIAFETYRMIAASSAMTLVRDHEAAVRSALTPASSAVECQTCNGTGKEGRHSICRDCDEVPASSAVEGEAVATEPHNIYPMSADPNIYTASSYANRSSGGFAPTPAGDDHFHDLREAYIRGATWYRKNEDFGELLYKAAYDYADKATAPLPASPAPQTEGK